MLEEQDVKKIGEVVERGIQASESRVIQAVGEILEQNILPQFDTIRAEMVTKSYLDDKLADLRGDLVVLTRKEDTKLRELVSVLREKNILTDPDIKRILSMEPFPQPML